jgi:hypothetical protein
VLINEITLKEDVAETKDLMAIAHYISNWMLSDANKYEHDTEELEIRDIQQILNKKIPDIKTYTVKWLLFKPMPERTKTPLKFVTHLPKNTVDGERGAYFPPPYHSININLDYILKKKGNPASTILHELQHALDDLKSGGRVLDKYVRPTDDFQSYLKHPTEINARFSQALWDLATNYETVARSDVYKAIKTNLAQHRLSNVEVENPKEYKRLITRAYKFLSDVSQIIDKKEKPGFVQTVKNLIKKYLLR